MGIEGVGAAVPGAVGRVDGDVMCCCEDVASCTKGSEKVTGWECGWWNVIEVACVAGAASWLGAWAIGVGSCVVGACGCAIVFCGVHEVGKPPEEAWEGEGDNKGSRVVKSGHPKVADPAGWS